MSGARPARTKLAWTWAVRWSTRAQGNWSRATTGAVVDGSGMRQLVTARRRLPALAARLASGIGEHDALDGVGDVVQAVQRLLQLLDDVLPDQHIAGRVLAGEGIQLDPGAPVDTVALLLKLGHRHLVGPQPHQIELAQVAQPAGGLLGGLEDDPGLLADRVDGLGDLVQDEHVGGLLDRVDDIIQLGGEGVDVLTVKGGDEGGVEPGQDGVGDAVAFVLALDQPLAFSSGSTKSSSRSSSSRADSAMLSAAASNRSKKDSSRGKIRSLMASASD